MPVYSFRCGGCGHKFDCLLDINEETPTVCPECGEGLVKRLFGAPAIKFRGSGFYATDYGPKHEARDGGTGEAKKSKVKEVQKDAAHQKV